MADPEQPVAPKDDPDFISQDGNDGRFPLGPGQFSTGFSRGRTPVFRPTQSTSLEEDDPDGVIPPAQLWAMKYQRNVHLLHRAETVIRERHGSGNATVYVIDDGRKHCMVSRLVGTGPDGCAYCLVGHITMHDYQQLRASQSRAVGIFSGARQLALCAVFVAEAAVSNVAKVDQYADVSEVPPEYLPPQPPITFTATP